MKSMRDLLEKWKDQGVSFLRNIWFAEPTTIGNRFIVRTVRYLLMVYRGFLNDNCLLRASGLAYSTVFSIVPVVAVVFAFLGAFESFSKYENRLLDVVIQQFVPPSAQGEEGVRQGITERIKNFISDAQERLRQRSTGIGAFGVAFLIVSVVTIMATIEDAFNAIWGVKGRPYRKRIVYYWFLTFIPILVALSLAFTGWVQSQGVIDWFRSLPLIEDLLATSTVAFMVGFLVTFFITWLAFLSLYYFMPNTKVHLKPAMKGAFWTTVLFEGAKWGSLLTGSSALTYSVIYGALAAVPLTLFWLYILWLIVLFGAEVCFAAQNFKTFARERRVGEASQATRETIALRILGLMAHQFQHGHPMLSANELSDAFDVPIKLVNDICGKLTDARILNMVHQDDDTLAYQPARALETITIKDVIDHLRRDHDDGLRGRIRPEDTVVLDVYNKGETTANEVFASENFEHIARLVDQQLHESGSGA